MSTNIYILRLQGGKYYIGKSDNPMKRYQEHIDGNGSIWTRKYKPINVITIIENASPFDEDKYTKEYMAKYGIENVRGGTYTSIQLDSIQLETIEREIRGAHDKCTRCGRVGHFARDCYARSVIAESRGSSVTKRDITCYRCDRIGHYKWQCYASTTVDGDSIEDSDDDDDDDDEYY